MITLKSDVSIFQLITMKVHAYDNNVKPGMLIIFSDWQPGYGYLVTNDHTLKVMSILPNPLDYL